MKGDPGKILDLEDGKVMVVSDLHGNWRDYSTAIETFLRLQLTGEAHYLVFLGDLIHARDGMADHSLQILDDLIQRNCNTEGSPFFALLGNHELVHIYHIELFSGNQDITGPLEDLFLGRRKEYIQFFSRMPFAIRTLAGVVLVHAGACKIIGEKKYRDFGVTFKKFRKWDHAKYLTKLISLLQLPSSTDPFEKFNRPIGWRFRDEPFGQFLWEVFFNKNEKRYGQAYHGYLEGFLKFISKKYPVEQRFLVSGHIRVPEGATIVGKKQLRISSSLGAANDQKKRYLLFDSKGEYRDIETLESIVHPLFPQ